MKVQLIVVQGKPEGKKIPLAGPRFKIGRGETCHLRPNSELVSREHAEFAIATDQVTVKDLGSRNGTLVNGKAITTEPFVLKSGDLVQVGPLTFAVTIEGAPATARAGAGAGGKAASLDEASNDQIESWLIADSTNQPPDRPSGVYGGDTLTIKAFKDKESGVAPAKAEAPAAPPEDVAGDDEEYERLPEGEGDAEEEGEEPEAEAGLEEEFIDESNPFYAAKKAQKEAEKKGPAGPAKPVYKDTSDAASEILKRMMERRRASKS